jgi:hypothetical protein
VGKAGPQARIDFLMAADFFFHGALHVISDSEGEVFGFHKPNWILQFSGTPATGFLGRLGGPASSPISCCCNEMLSLDGRLEGSPSVPKSCKKWRFSRAIRAFVHHVDLAVLGLERSRHCLL